MHIVGKPWGCHYMNIASKPGTRFVVGMELQARRMCPLAADLQAALIAQGTGVWSIRPWKLCNCIETISKENEYGGAEAEA